MLEKIDERINLGPILNGPFLFNLCHSNDTGVIIAAKRSKSSGGARILIVRGSILGEYIK